jgi:hypothetical protein
MNKISMREVISILLEFIPGCCGVYGIGRLMNKMIIPGLVSLFILTPIFLLFNALVLATLVGGRLITYIGPLFQIIIAFIDIRLMVKTLNERREVGMNTHMDS